MFPGLLINLNLQTEKGDGGTEGSVVNHVGFIVDNVQKRTAQWKAAGVAVLPGNNNRMDQAFVVTPDGVRMEILEDKTQAMPIRGEHVHLSVPDADRLKGCRVVREDLRGQSRYAQQRAGRGSSGRATPLRQSRHEAGATRGRILDHIGFDVKDHAAVVKRLEAAGIKLDEPPRKSAAGNTVTYITDPWGTRIEIVQRAPLGPEVK
jgi:catechol 2,3-dioxygenase-like lactoylglutathione lyase family enzyme